MRGKQYFFEGRVQDFKVEPARIGAILEGDSRYKTAIRRIVPQNKFNSPSRTFFGLAKRSVCQIEMQCECPFSLSGRPCKHLWALLLHATQLDQFPDCTDLAALSGAFVLIVHVNSNLRLRSTLESDRNPFLSSTGHFSHDSPAWKSALLPVFSPTSGPTFSSDRVREVFYLFDSAATLNTGRFTIQLGVREQSKGGSWGPLKRRALSAEEMKSLDRMEDQELLELLIQSGASDLARIAVSVDPAKERKVSSLAIAPSFQVDLIARLCASGKLLVNAERDEAQLFRGGAPKPKGIRFDESGPWIFQLKLVRETSDDGPPGDYELEAGFSKGDQWIEIHEPSHCLPSGLLIHPKWIGLWSRSQAEANPLALNQTFEWIKLFRRHHSIRIPANELGSFLDSLSLSQNLPDISWPKDLAVPSATTIPRGHVAIQYTHFASNARSEDHAHAFETHFQFSYDGSLVRPESRNDFFFSPRTKQISFRNREIESELLKKFKHLLESLGVEARQHGDAPRAELPRETLARFAHLAMDADFEVVAMGMRTQKSTHSSISVSSGLDWFDLTAKVEFEGGVGAEASMEAILEALRNRSPFVKLGNGQSGLLPEAWLTKLSALSNLSDPSAGPPVDEQTLRFNKAQAFMLAAILGNETKSNEELSMLFRHIESFGSLKERNPSTHFKGTLREYQKQGLTWLRYLRECHLGGVLADDMGLGKTIQVLAHLCDVYKTKKPPGAPARKPTLIVVPKTILFNWHDEANKFSPTLKVFTYDGPDRKKTLGQILNHHVVLVSYPIMRLDIEDLGKVPFDTVILDEAQAIKNEKSLSHKAARSLVSEFRIAMTGTPIENSVQDLFSIMDFLNPRLLGAQMRAADQETGIAKALSPLILRRTKGQVLKDLPPKTETLLTCELSPEERTFYNGLRDHYRSTLTENIDAHGLGKTKINALEALLRLRQAACHQGLLASVAKNTLAPAALTSSKFDTLCEKLGELISEGHKALVFSQFTSLLALLKERLDREQVSYLYLDGKTKTQDRKKLVESFQADASKSVFLISLKAGGVGLNLTSADYVFILDPWWNPAVESQAVDRAHRMGQTRPVISYRLIARDTVEEKILILQSKKKALAEAIVLQQSGPLKGMTRDDLQFLLS